MKIIQMLAPVKANGARPGIKRTKNGGVTIHNTGNFKRGAGAKNHGTYLQNGGANAQASWHYAVDDTNIVQSIPSDEVAWHAGDGRGNGNMTTEAIEICVNPDSDLTKATDNAAWLAAQRLKAQGLGLDHLYQHRDWSGKNCPAELRAGKPYSWATFKSKVAAYLGNGTTATDTKPKPTAKKTIEQIAQEVMAGKWGNGDTRKQKLKAAGYDYNTVQAKVNELCGVKSKPTATKPKPATPKKQTVTLPASAPTWRVYRTNVAPVVGNECGMLAPARYNGLTYEILARPQKDVVTIRTQTFGEVNIFVGPGTGAIIK